MFVKMADKNRNRNRNINLSALYALPSDVALKSGKPRDGVYGYVTKNTPYICKPQREGSKTPPQHLRDMTDPKVPTVLKNRILAFYSDPNNKQKGTCYLGERSIYEEFRGSKTATVPKVKTRGKTKKNSTGGTPSGF